jgi:hypothetical protein
MGCLKLQYYSAQIPFYPWNPEPVKERAENVVQMWLSVDPMAEKHPEMSPYNYCSLNPVIRFDPNGKTDYVLLPNGTIERYGPENNEPDRLGTRAQDGKIHYITVSDKSLLRDLAVNRAKIITEDANGTVISETIMRYASSKSKSDVVKVFSFVGKYSKVEWTVYSSNNNSGYYIGSYGLDDLSPSSEDYGLNEVNVQTMVHNHLKKSSESEEIASLYGDKSVAMGVKYNYYTYYPHSKNLYKIDNKSGEIACTKNAGIEKLSNALGK